MNKHLITLVMAVLFILVVGLSGCEKSQNKNNEMTPDIQFNQEFGGLSVEAIFPGGLWSNMNITISAGNYSDIQLSPALHTSTTYSYGNGTSCPERWGYITPGNRISFLLFEDNTTVTLRWIPTDAILGEWNFT